jgi:monovalent cation/hydrogen antiporter
VAWAAHAFGLAWGPAWTLGAVVAPTDATAVSALARGLPRRTLTTLRAESLINDGTALVIYAIAVGVTRGTQHADVGNIAGRFALSYAVGVAVGLLVSQVAVMVRHAGHDALIENTVSVLTPFAAFLVADLLHGSGVLAVVACGLRLSQVGPRAIPARTRVQASAFWGLATFVLNGALFVLVGLQFRNAVEGLSATSVRHSIYVALAITGVVIGARLAWLNTTPYVIRALDRRPQQRARRVSWRGRLPSAWCGLRGAVSLAAALGIPQTVKDGSPFPDRALIIFVTATVIAVTITLQGLTLPAVIRFARLPPDEAFSAEVMLAEQAAVDAARRDLDRVAADLGTPEEFVERYRTELEERAQRIRDGDPQIAEDGHDHSYEELRLALLEHKRAEVVRLRDERKIDDTVLRRLQSRFDVEEIRLSRGEDPQE